MKTFVLVALLGVSTVIADNHMHHGNLMDKVGNWNTMTHELSAACTSNSDCDALEDEHDMAFCCTTIEKRNVADNSLIGSSVRRCHPYYLGRAMPQIHGDGVYLTYRCPSFTVDSDHS